MRTLYFSILLALTAFCSPSFASFPDRQGGLDELSYHELASELLYRIKEDEPYQKVQKKLQNASKDEIEADLNTEAKKLAFWLNVYNAHIQILLKNEPSLYKDRDAFFGKERVLIAGKELSFDKIEHGIIRHSKVKVSMGYANKMFPGSFEKRFRLKEVDPRIHFALNCGAKNCPPVAVYHADRLDEELDYMSKTLLEETTELKNGEAHVIALFSWFRADFGGKDGIREMLRGYGIIDEKAEPDLAFKDYDWTLSLDNYREWADTPLGAYR